MKALIEFYDEDLKKIDEVVINEVINEDIRLTCRKRAKEYINKYDFVKEYQVTVEYL
jgi:hypothetical protein